MNQLIWPEHAASDSVASEQTKKKKKDMGRKCAERCSLNSFICVSAARIWTRPHPSTRLFSRSFILAEINCTNNTLWPEFISNSAATHKCNFQRKYCARQRMACSNTTTAATNIHSITSITEAKKNHSVVTCLTAASLWLHSKSCAAIVDKSLHTRIEISVVYCVCLWSPYTECARLLNFTIIATLSSDLLENWNLLYSGSPFVYPDHIGRFSSPKTMSSTSICVSYFHVDKQLHH